jgi:formiminotetrahydrofolate cyclodeaminase
MGAALVAKTARATLRQQPADGATQATLKAAYAQARAQHDVLLELAQADERAYRAVLDTAQEVSEPGVPAGDSEGRQVRIAATEIPIRIAEVCQGVLDDVSHWMPLCWPAVRPDLVIGIELLQVGVRAGVLSAEANLRAWAKSLEGSSLQDESGGGSRTCE